MKHQRHFDPTPSTSRDVARINALIGDIDRIVRILDGDIANEEERTGIFDRLNPAYSIFAGTLAARRDNLRQTIAVLKERIANIPALD